VPVVPWGVAVAVAVVAGVVAGDALVDVVLFDELLPHPATARAPTRARTAADRLIICAATVAGTVFALPYRTVSAALWT
jgi:hypothetical protein